jgi:two-component system cell cycle response regulator
MIAVTADLPPTACRQVSETLEQAGWVVHHAPDADAAVDHCRDAEADVLMVGTDAADGQDSLLQRVTSDADLFSTAVVLLAEAPEPAEVLDWIQRGAVDVLLSPPAPADVLARAFAAARTKALVKELTAQNARLEELVLFDELTGLRNRRAMLHEVEMLTAVARRHDHPLSILMLDIDRFKAINDGHGHLVGDEVLRDIGRRVRGRLRTADVAGRLGGDELLIALPETGVDGADTLAESVREAIGATPVRTSAGPVDVTVSIGVAGMEPDDDASVLLERADAALYAAKAAGRDRAARAR